MMKILCLLLMLSYSNVFAQYKVLECYSGDCENGIGEARLDNFRNYRGEFKNGKLDGMGVMLDASYYGEKPLYVGEFKNGMMHGKGTDLYKRNAEYAEGIFANGFMASGTIYFETGKLAVISATKDSKTGLLYTGKMIGTDRKETPFTNTGFPELQEMAYNQSNIARNPKMMEELSADIKAMTAMFKQKFEKVDRMMASYADFLNCLPDDMACAQLNSKLLIDDFSMFTMREATELDQRVDRIQKNLIDYRTRPNTTAQDKKDAAMLITMIDRLKSRDLMGPQTNLSEGLEKALTAIKNSNAAGQISVMKANFPFQKIAIKEQREKDWDAWTILTNKF